MESNDSPEIPGRGETSDIPGFPSRRGGGVERERLIDCSNEKCEESIKSPTLKFLPGSDYHKYAKSVIVSLK